MGEQSHLEAMREAVRGDLERARSRNPSIFAAPPEPEPEPEPEPPEAPSNNLLEGEPEVVPEVLPDPEVELEPEPVAAREPVLEEEPAAEEEPPAGEEPPAPKRSRFRFWRG
jgi:hypothetical protein